jgi:pimeloyl-ACP methyl ester carboxylesterase
MDSRFIEVEGLRLHYREHGTGDPVLLLHGWPTSSYLWRDVMRPIGDAGRRAIALDLPGFGKSDKPDASYSFRFHARVLSGFLDALSITRTSLVVHDLGGPIGLYWAKENEHRVDALGLCNTIVYPEFSWAVVAFVAACRAPIMRRAMASQWGLGVAMRTGVHDPSRLGADAIREVQAPFRSRASQRALLRTAYGLHMGGFRDLAAWMPTVKIPVRIVYGARDRILPDVAQTMQRVKRDVPHAEITALDDCGHFLQEERGAEVGELFAAFLSEKSAYTRDRRSLR